MSGIFKYLGEKWTCYSRADELLLRAIEMFDNFPRDVINLPRNLCLAIAKNGPKFRSRVGPFPPLPEKLYDTA